MNRLLKTLAVAALAATASAPAFADSPRECISMDDGWKFALGHACDREKDFGFNTSYFSYLTKIEYGTDGPASSFFDDRPWREVCLPHDWAVEMPFDSSASYSHGFRAVGPGFPQNSVGWYRHRFFIPESDLGRRISVEFEGIFRDSKVFVNGFYAGGEASGYISQRYEIAEYLNYGGENDIVVRVDASSEEGWFYEGAGIYRHAWLEKTGPVHIKSNGTWIRTPDPNEKAAAVNVESCVRNDSDADGQFAVVQAISDPRGKEVASGTATVSIKAHAEAKCIVSMDVRHPDLWSPDNPALYTLSTKIKNSDGAVEDDTSQKFGIRNIHFDTEHGMFLNGKPIKLLGMNIHQDHAGVGTAMPDALIEWRLLQLKKMGVNAIRMAHNEASPAMLDICDRIGLFVLEENRLMGVNDYQLGQLRHIIECDRNHPSIFIWSLGNEEWGIEGNIKGARIAKTMQDFAHSIDPDRICTVAISGGWGGISTVVDAAGVNYIRQATPDKQHEDFPWQVIIGTEETTGAGTRGVYKTDADAGLMASYGTSDMNDAMEEGWKYYDSRKHTVGVFYWTGFDYRGEPVPFGYPANTSQFGVLDTCGFPKDCYYYLKSWWTSDPVIHIMPDWNPEGKTAGEAVHVRIDGNCDEAELVLNGQSLGRRTMPHDGHIDWDVPYEPGELKALGYKNGSQVSSDKVVTSGPAAEIVVDCDHTDLSADGRDLAVVNLKIVDDKGNFVPGADNLLHFSVSGPGRIIGVGNGAPASLEDDVKVEQCKDIPLGMVTKDQATALKGGDPVTFDCTFDEPDASAPGSTLTLYLNPIGDAQTVTLNGKTICENASRKEAKMAVSIEAGMLKPSGNTLSIRASSFEQYGDRENVGKTYAAQLGLQSPAKPWQRHAFKGLAQVLVQSDKTAGDIVLSVTSDGLPVQKLTLHSSEP